MAWLERSTLPYEFYSGSAVVYNGKIHILGGGDLSGTYTAHYSWDGTSWTRESTLPYYFYRGSAVVYNGKIHILGGGNSSDTADNHYSWDGTEWVEESTLPYRCYNGSAVVYNNKIHILGGSSSGTVTNHYSWNGTEWIEESTLPYNFSYGSAVVYDNKIHIMYLIAHYSWDGSSWTEESTLPYMFSSSVAIVYNNKIYIIGSNSSNSKLRIRCYSWDESSWTEESALLYVFRQGAGVVYNNKIHILGGHDSTIEHSHLRDPINIVNYGNERILDLTKDTVDSDKLLKDYIAHNAAGDNIRGSLSPTSITPSNAGAYFTSGYANMQTSGYAYSQKPPTYLTGTWEQSAVNETFSVTVPSKPKMVVIYKELSLGANNKAAISSWFEDDPSVYRSRYNNTGNRPNLGARATGGYSRYTASIDTVSNTTVSFTGVSIATSIGTWSYCIIL